MSRQSRNKIITSFFYVMTHGINKSYIFEKENEIKIIKPQSDDDFIEIDEEKRAFNKL